MDIEDDLEHLAKDTISTDGARKDGGTGVMQHVDEVRFAVLRYLRAVESSSANTFAPRLVATIDHGDGVSQCPSNAYLRELLTKPQTRSRAVAIAVCLIGEAAKMATEVAQKREEFRKRLLSPRQDGAAWSSTGEGLLSNTGTAGIGTLSAFSAQHSANDDPTDNFGCNASVMSLNMEAAKETEEAKKVSADDGKFINQYLFLDTLGRGTTGKVRLAINGDNGQNVAIKILKRHQFRSAERQQQLRREIAVMKRLRHKNLVSLYEVIDDPRSDKLYLVMQYVDSGQLFEISSHFTCAVMTLIESLSVARQLSAGLAYLHKHRIVHRDIKPENILKSSNGSVYLSDFGLSENFLDNNEGPLAAGGTGKGDGRVTGGLGTPMFMAPELQRIVSGHKRGRVDMTMTWGTISVMDGTNEQTIDGYAADVWSLGVTFYLMVVGRFPYDSVETMERKIMYPPDIHAPWRALLERMLRVRPTERPTVLEIHAAVKTMQGVDLLLHPTPSVADTDQMGESLAPIRQLSALMVHSETYSHASSALSTQNSDGLGDDDVANAITLAREPPRDGGGGRASFASPPPRGDSPSTDKERGGRRGGDFSPPRVERHCTTAHRPPGAPLSPARHSPRPPGRTPTAAALRGPADGRGGVAKVPAVSPWANPLERRSSTKAKDERTVEPSGGGSCCTLC